MPNPTPDAPRLAALLDGRLGVAEREQLLGELAASDDALGAYADAAAALGELEREGIVPEPAGPVRPVAGPAATPAPNAPGAAPGSTPVVSLAEAPARRRPFGGWPVRRWAAVAAAAVVAAGPALWWRTQPDDGATAGVPSSVALLAPEARSAGLPAGWDGTPWRVTRGAGDPLTAEARAVRVGARVTDLELAAAAGDTAAARAVAADVAALLDEVPGGGAAAAAYRALDAGAGAAALARARRDAALVAGEEGFAFGAWLEAARVAAARRDAAFFRSGASRAALERLRGSTEGERVLAAAAAREPAAWPALGDALAALLRARGG